jgi:intermediate peptidase
MYGITLEPESPLLGEVWHDTVRKLAVVHQTEGRIGTIYCDLYKRNEEEDGVRKYENPAHFTIR